MLSGITLTLRRMERLGLLNDQLQYEMAQNRLLESTCNIILIRQAVLMGVFSCVDKSSAGLIFIGNNRPKKQSGAQASCSAHIEHQLGLQV
jgi:hypothetical protein